MLDQTFLATVPHAPGVYLMLDRSASVLYVGKAKDLAKRLSSYVHYSGSKTSKTAVLLGRVQQVDLLITHTEKEALILEASLIKRHRPKYNVILRDDKSYPLIKVTVQEQWPRVFMTRRKKRDGARYFGPYASASAMWQTLRLLTTLFPLRRCRGNELRPRKRPCLNYQMQRCLAPCAGKANHQEYLDMVEKVVMFLEGRSKNLLADLEQEMMSAADGLDFERAAILRDRLQAVRETLEKQIIVSQTARDRDVFGWARLQSSVAAVLLVVREGIVTGSRRFLFDDPYGDDASIIAQIITQLYDEQSPPPPEILVPQAIEDQDLIAERLSDLAGRRVSLHFPRRGEPAHLVKMATANAQQIFAEEGKKKRSWEALAELIARSLHLQKTPRAIECFDISNISGTNAIGSLVRFTEGEPESGGYRRYRLAEVAGPDDYAMMRATLRRRCLRALATDDLPDLLVIDGGRGHLGIAEAVVKDLALDEAVELVGIAKEHEREGDKLYRPGRKNPILLPAHNPVLLFFMRVRDEAHRFGITAHRALRRKQALRSRLDAIPGIGAARKRLLLRRLGSLQKIAVASAEELQAVDGIGPELAQTIVRYFQPADSPSEVLPPPPAPD
ncbi:MAG: excinuclease ABC subunit UvrC [Desulfofustis sp.]|jgi:excinuclease ABC subunit C|nr:excinuclease ABC subunit UvrC [Desulfofustis sp.]